MQRYNAFVLCAMTAAPGGGSAPPTTVQVLNNDPGLNKIGGSVTIFMTIVVSALVILLFAPVVYGALLEARTQRARQKFAADLLPKRDRKHALSPDEFATIAESYTKIVGDRPRSEEEGGDKGLTSTLLALATLTLVGLALVVVLVSSSSDAMDLRKLIITALVSILASISGFYFGARTAQKSAAQAQASGGSGGTPPTFTLYAPPTAGVVAGQEYSYRFVATGSPPPTYRLVDADSAPWLSIDSDNGTVSGTAVAGVCSFSVLASNSAGLVSAGPFEVTVREPAGGT